MLAFETILFLFLIGFGAFAYWLPTSKRRKIMELAKQSSSEPSEKDTEELEELRRARASISGMFWLLAAIVLTKIIARLIP